MQALKASRPATGQGEPTSELAQAGGPRKFDATNHAFHAQDDLARTIEIFRLRCDARSRLAAEGLIDQQTAVDVLWQWAESSGLVAAFGVDEVQSLMNASFSIWSGYGHD